MENYFVVLGDFILFLNIRLRFYKNENFFLRLLEFFLLVDIKSLVGVLFMVIMVVESLNFVFFEGCM